MNWEAWSNWLPPLMHSHRTPDYQLSFSDVEMKAALVIDPYSATRALSDDDFADQLELEGADHRANVMLIRMFVAALLVSHSQARLRTAKVLRRID